MVHGVQGVRVRLCVYVCVCVRAFVCMECVCIMHMVYRVCVVSVYSAWYTQCVYALSVSRV